MDTTRSHDASHVRERAAAATPEQATARVAWLVPELQRHASLYYEHDAAEIDDRAYDLLFLELKLLEERFPELQRADSPTRRVGGKPVDGLRPFPHDPPMLSLDNAFDEVDLRSFLVKTKDGRTTGGLVQVLRKAGAEVEVDALEMIVEPKLDGLAIELVYVNGELEKAGTRGDGETGEDVTHTMACAVGVPRRLRGVAPARLCVRGEVVLPVTTFLEANRALAARGDKPFENERNSVAGLVRQLDPAAAASWPPRFYAHSLGSIEGMPWPETERAVLAAFEAWGFDVTGHERVCAGVEAVLEAIDQLQDTRPKLPFAIDGAVLKLNDVPLQRLAGETDHHPKWAIAYKYPPKLIRTVLNDVEFSVGRSGIITPVAILEPVRVGTNEYELPDPAEPAKKKLIEIGGVTVSRATLHNLSFIEGLGLRKGAMVEIYRSGDVIPKIERVVDDPLSRLRAPIDPPSSCPACGQPTRVEESLDVRTKRAVRTLRCTGDGQSCSGQLKRAIEHFVSRSAMDIEGFGSQLVELLVDRGIVRSIPDIYGMNPAQVASLEGLGELSAANLDDQLKLSKNRGFKRLLIGLGIPGVGGQVAGLLAEVFVGFPRLRSASLAEITAAISTAEKSIGGRVAGTLREYLDNPAAVEALAGAVDGGASLAEALAGCRSRVFGKKQGGDWVTTDIGWKRAHGIAIRFGALESLLSASLTELAEVVPLMPSETAKNIRDWLDDPRNISLVDALEAHEVAIEDQDRKPVEQVAAVADKTFVLTGTFSSMKRSEAKARIEAAGGKVTGSVTSKTHFLVKGEGGGKKSEEAKKLGTEIIDEARLLELLGDKGL